MPPSSAPANDFLKSAAAPQYVEKMGFTLRKIPVFDYLPASLLSLDHMPEKKRNAVKDTFREMYFWVMTVKEMPVQKADAAEIPFSIRTDRSDDHLNITISGRLDTITAPDLLSIYQEECSKGKLRSITIDSGFLTYISSAGLRVFLIMRKALGDGGRFYIRNIRKNVKEILDTTGFSSLFNCEG